MDCEAVAKAAGIIPEAKLGKFLEYLVRFPEKTALLGEPHSSESRLQGDLLHTMPFAIVTSTGEAKVAQFMVAVLNNTCDLQPGRSEFINLAPVFGYKEYSSSIYAERSADSASGYLDAVRRNKVTQVFYIDKCPGYSEGVIVLLDRIATVSATLYETAVEGNKRIASFTQNGFFVFLLKITNYFARAETPDVERSAPVPVER